MNTPLHLQWSISRGCHQRCHQKAMPARGSAPDNVFGIDAATKTCLAFLSSLFLDSLENAKKAKLYACDCWSDVLLLSLRFFFGWSGDDDEVVSPTERRSAYSFKASFLSLSGELSFPRLTVSEEASSACSSSSSRFRFPATLSVGLGFVSRTVVTSDGSCCPLRSISWWRNRC